MSVKTALKSIDKSRNNSLAHTCTPVVTFTLTGSNQCIIVSMCDKMTRV